MKVGWNRSLSLLLMFLAGCNYQVKKNAGSGPAANGNKPVAAIAFEEVYSKVLNTYCTKCHDDFANYATVMEDVKAGSASTSPLFLRLKNNGGDMPGRGNPMIPQEAATLIRDWIDSGAVDTSNGESTKPPGPAPVPIPPVPVPEPTPVPVPSSAPIVNPASTDLDANVPGAAGAL